MNHIRFQTVCALVLFFLYCYGVNANNQPRIRCSNQTLLIPENKPVGTLLLTCTAYDPDNERVIFSAADDVTRSMVTFSTTTNSNTLTAHVFVKKEFDREGVQPGKISYVLTFRAEDPSQLAAEFTNNVYPSDVNDNPPLFSQPAYFFEIDEGDYFKTQISGSMSITATDADSNGANPIFEFYLTPKGQLSSQYGNLISVETKTTNDIHTRIANIYVNGTVDYETLSFYQFDIMAKDIGQPPLNTTASLTIKVKDKQDMPPIFQGLPYIYDVYENIANWSKLLQISAEDGDRGIPRIVNYGIQSDDCGALFQVEAKTGEFHTISNLDREARYIQNISGICKVNITAYEIFNNGTVVNTPNSRSYTIATITILDEDDNPPAFNLAYVKANISEGILNSPITFENINGISVQDKDQGENSVFGLTLKYMNNTDIDRLEVLPKLIQGSGSVQVNVKKPFDYEIEVEQHFNFKIVATSKTNSSVTAECQVSLSVLDVNDNDPHFDNYPAEGYNAYIPENQKFGSIITVISAHDKDSEDFGKVSYALEGSGKKFTINNVTGEVTVACNCSESGLDAETQDTYYVTVEAKDGGGRRSAASLQIKLTDINDNAPQFLYNKYETSWKEDEAFLGTGNLKVNAYDQDRTTPNSRILYKIYPPTYLKNNITIDMTSGEIIILKKLNYQSLHDLQNVINITVEATDMGIPSLSSNTSLIIHTKRKQDTGGEHDEISFSKAAYFIEIYEGTYDNALRNETNITLEMIQPTEYDQDIKFDIQCPNEANKLLDVLTVKDQKHTTLKAFVIVNGKLDFEANSLYQCTINAMKNETTLTEADLLIKVLDVQDMPPSFNGQPYIATIYINDQTKQVLQVIAKDGDYKNQRKIQYEIVNLDVCSSLFNINQTTGVIFSSEVLEQASSSLQNIGGLCHLKINAYEVNDNGTKYNNSLDTSSAIVTIKVLKSDGSVFRPTCNEGNFSSKFGQTAAILYNKKKGEVQAIGSSVMSHLSSLTNYSFTWDRTKSMWGSDGCADIDDTYLHFHVTDPNTGYVFTPEEAMSLFKNRSQELFPFTHGCITTTDICNCNY